jgi:hypothetical protein
MIDPKEASEILTDTILHDKRHLYYDRVCKLADMYERFITGEGLENDLQHIVSRETEQQFQLRKKLFFPLVPAICHRADVPFTKVHRAQGTIESMNFGGKKSAQHEKNLKAAMDGFHGDEDLTDYMADRFRELNRVDPNAYIIVEFEPFDPVTKKARPYPLEISSSQAINWSKSNNKIDWMIAKFDHTMVDRDGKKMEQIGERYVMYFGHVLDFREVIPSEVDGTQLDAFVPKRSTDRKPQLVKIGGKLFECRLMHPFDPSQEIRFQGTQPGHLKDPKTKGETYISYLHHAKNRMLDTLKSGSEHSLIMSLQAHPQIWMYLDSCEGERNDQGRREPCSDGRNIRTGTTCTRCNGSGKNIPTSVLDIMYVDMPDDLSQLQDLSKMMHHFSPDVALITAVRDHLRDLEDQSVRDIFTSLQHQRGKTTATATEINVDSDAMNDALHPYARKVSTSRTVIVEVMAAFVDADKNLTYTHRFPDDFRLAPLAVLLDDLGKAKSADASPMLRELIEDDAVAKKLRDRPLELRQYQVRKMFRPLRHLPPAERATAMANGEVVETDRILYNYEPEVYRVLGKDEAFWFRDEEAQKKLIDEQVQAILKRVREEKAAEIDFAAEMQPEEVEEGGNGGFPA